MEHKRDYWHSPMKPQHHEFDDLYETHWAKEIDDDKDNNKPC